VAVAAVGTFRGEIAMFIDGIYDRHMQWEFEPGNGTLYYDMASYAGHGAATAPVKEGYFWPVDINMPNDYFVVDTPNGQNYNKAGDTRLQITSHAGGLPTLDLPTQGLIALKSNGVVSVYEYYNVTPSGHMMLYTPLQQDAAVGDKFVTLIPVVRAILHKDANAGATPQDPTSVPRAGDQVIFYEHTLLQAGPPAVYGNSQGFPETVGSIVTPAGINPSDNLLKNLNCTWLEIDPDQFPIGGNSANNFLYGHWKVYNTDAGAHDLLGGALPCDPQGGTNKTFRIGGSAGGTAENFLGTLDDVRVTSLASCLVPLTGNGWTSGTATLTGTEWTIEQLANWSQGGAPPFYIMDILPQGNAPASLSNPLVAAGSPEMFPTGGYFILRGTDPAGNPIDAVEQYSGYAPASGNPDQITGVAAVGDDLQTSTTNNPGWNAKGLRRIIPLSFLTTTRLSGAITVNSAIIPLGDVSALPASGYLKVGDEILAYNSVNTANSTVSETSEAYRRGCYNTTAAAHNANDIVRLVPVREVDRYKAETTTPADVNAPSTWDYHTSYYAAGVVSSAAGMSMLSFPVPSNAGDLVKDVTWTLKNPLSAGQKVAVLVSLDTGSVDWGTNPDTVSELLLQPSGTTDWGTSQPGAGYLEQYSSDDLWGTLLRSGVAAYTGPDNSQYTYTLDPFNSTGAPPASVTPVEIRVYFDLSGQNVYNHTYSYVAGKGTVTSDPHYPVELDSLGIDLVPQPSVF
jgi:hypothetical protein